MSTFDGYFREFNGLIRADNFGKPPSWLGHAPQVHLLSHAHSDHMKGLETFSSAIYCSSLTRELVLKHRPAADRVYQEIGHDVASKPRTYSHLAARSNSPVNLLRVLPLLEPTEISVNNGNGDQCLVTLISANHCPGSVMFLLQMWGKSVLYTGDIRAEPWWVESLSKVPLLAPFLGYHQSAHQEGGSSNPHKALDNIYLDTSGLLYKKDVLIKEESIVQTLRMMSFYPVSTIFFINAWTWGYEELLERISMHFKVLIHVDRYKFEIYSQPLFKKHYPLLAKAITPDPQSTRFHACERYWRCDECWGTGEKSVQLTGMEEEVSKKVRRCAGKRIVQVEPREMPTEKWTEYKHRVFRRLKSANKRLSTESIQDDPWPGILLSPFVRHSSFSELYRFISIFKPLTLFPNTTQARLGFVEYHVMPALFASALQAGGAERLKAEALKYSHVNQHKASSLDPVGSQALADLLSVTIPSPSLNRQPLIDPSSTHRAPMDVDMVSQDHEAVDKVLHRDQVVDKIFQEYEVLSSQYGGVDDYLNEAEVQALGSLNASTSVIKDVTILGEPYDTDSRNLPSGASSVVGLPVMIDLTGVRETPPPSTSRCSPEDIAFESFVDSYAPLCSSCSYSLVDTPLPTEILSFKSSTPSLLMEEMPSGPSNHRTVQLKALPLDPFTGIIISVDDPSNSAPDCHLIAVNNQASADTGDSVPSMEEAPCDDVPLIRLHPLATPILDRQLSRESHKLQKMKYHWWGVVDKFKCLGLTRGSRASFSSKLTDEERRIILRRAVIVAIRTSRQWNTIVRRMNDILDEMDVEVESRLLGTGPTLLNL